MKIPPLFTPSLKNSNHFNLKSIFLKFKHFLFFLLRFTKANQLCREEVNASTRLFSSSPRKVWTFTSFKLKDRTSFPFLTKRCSCLIVSLLWSASSFCMAGKRCYAIKLPTGVDELNISCNLSCT